MKSLDLNDSAIAIYWKEQPLKPGAKREVGFEYGLWNLASQGSRLAATVDGAFRPDGRIDRGRLRQPAGRTSDGRDRDFDAAGRLQAPRREPDASASQAGRRTPGAATCPVTWKVQAGPTGKYEFTVTSSSGLSQTLPVEIRKSILD